MTRNDTLQKKMDWLTRSIAHNDTIRETTLKALADPNYPIDLFKADEVLEVAAHREVAAIIRMVDTEWKSKDNPEVTDETVLVFLVEELERKRDWYSFSRSSSYSAQIVNGLVQEALVRTIREVRAMLQNP